MYNETMETTTLAVLTHERAQVPGLLGKHVHHHSGTSNYQRKQIRQAQV